MNIVKEIGMPAALGQLAEEAAELAQAALKLQRILMGCNPTPVTMNQARKNLAEETTDVELCLTLIETEDPGLGMNWDLFLEKKHRWEHRIWEADKNA